MPSQARLLNVRRLISIFQNVLDVRLQARGGWVSNLEAIM